MQRVYFYRESPGPPMLSVTQHGHLSTRQLYAVAPPHIRDDDVTDYWPNQDDLKAIEELVTSAAGNGR